MTTVVVHPTSSTTALDLIRGALSNLRVLAQDSALTEKEEADGLAVLNDMLDSWTLNPVNLYRETTETVTTAAKSGNTPHTMGLGGDWNTARPVAVDGLTFAIAGNYDQPVQLIGWDDYAAIRLKGLAVNYPQYAYVSYGYPFAQVYLYPVPGAGQTLTVWSRKPLATFVSTSDAVSLPPGYVRAIKYNLAVDMALTFDKEIDANVIILAQNSLRQLQRANLRIPTIATEPALRSHSKAGGNIYSDVQPFR